MSATGKTVTVIPPKRIIGTQTIEKSNFKTRVAAYCRVSTDLEEQESSYEVQVSHYTDLIKNKPEWQFVDIYADDGISGTNTSKREAFNKMIKDCEDGKIDMILTKSISRFSRNTVDCLKYTRRLKELNIAVFFEKENINTLDSKGEVLMTIMAALAQQESESLSANVKLGIQYRNQEGKIMVNTNWFLGYTKDKDGNLIIDEEQAIIVRRIYQEFLDGASYAKIQKGLEKDGIKNGAGHTKWHASNIRHILSNEKYIGDALLQKTYTVSLLDKKRAKNTGQRTQYYVKDSHEAIIDKEVFSKVQTEIERRARITKQNKSYGRKYEFSGIVYCGICGAKYYRVKWNNHGCRSTVWRCNRRLNKKNEEIKCCAVTLREEQLQQVVLDAVNQVFSERELVLSIMNKNIKGVVFEYVETKIKAIDEKMVELEETLMSVLGDEILQKEIGDKIKDLMNQKQKLIQEMDKQTEKINALKDFMAFVENQEMEIIEYSDKLVNRLVEKITVLEDGFVVRMKSGIEIEI